MKILPILIELLILGGRPYFLITTLGEMAGYYTIGEGYGWVQLLFWVMLILNSLFYILIRIGIETKQKFLFFVPVVIYLFVMILGPGAWFSGPFLQGFLALGIVGLLFVVLPILTVLALRYLFLKLLATKKHRSA